MPSPSRSIHGYFYTYPGQSPDPEHMKFGTWGPREKGNSETLQELLFSKNNTSLLKRTSPNRTLKKWPRKVPSPKTTHYTGMVHRHTLVQRDLGITQIKRHPGPSSGRSGTIWQRNNKRRHPPWDFPHWVGQQDKDLRDTSERIGMTSLLQREPAGAGWDLIRVIG